MDQRSTPLTVTDTATFDNGNIQMRLRTDADEFFIEDAATENRYFEVLPLENYWSVTNGEMQVELYDVAHNAGRGFTVRSYPANILTYALTVSNIGFATTTLSGLNINGHATTTSNVGYNITTGCYAINGKCVGGSTFSKGASATTTVNFGEIGNSTSHACFNTKNTDGNDISFYFVGTTMVVESNLCQ